MSNSRTMDMLRAAVSPLADRLTGGGRRQKRRARTAAAGQPMQLDALEPRTMMARTLGVDVSQWQGAVDWNQVRASGKEFAFARASEGNAAADPNLAANMTGGAAAGLLMAAYHHAQPDTVPGDAAAEALFFLSTLHVGSAVDQTLVGPGWLRPVVGVYSGGEMGAAALSQWVNTFEQTVRDTIGIDPVIYTNTDYATHYLDASVRTHDLWIANWDTTSYGDPLTTGSPPVGVGSTMGWAANDWDFWHYSSTGSVPGVGGAVDLDAFRGDRSALESQFLVPGAPSFQLSVNFGPYETAAPAGYVNFADQTYGAYQGYTMGWSSSGATLVAQTAGTAPDTRYRTFAKPGGRSFTVDVPNGWYRVRVVAGSPDPADVGLTQTFSVQGTTVINTQTHTGTEFLSAVVTVRVTSGQLVIGSSGGNSKLAFLDVVSLGRSDVLPAAPSAVTATPASATAVDVRWQDNADNEGRDPVAFDSAHRGDVDQGYLVERRDWNGTTWSAWATRGYAAADAELYQDTGLAAGMQYQYRVTAINAAGSSAAATGAAVTTPATSAQQAYTPGGAPWAVPATIQAEDFDRGGEGAGYHDLSAGNAGGAYRDGVGADVGRLRASEAAAPLTPRQYYVGWMRPGEWTAYTINVPAAGTYVMSFRLSNAGSASSGRKFHASTVQPGGAETNLAAGAPGGQWDVPSTGNWNAYTTVYRLVALPAGVQTIRLYADAAPAGNTTVMNVDWLAIAAAPALPPGPTQVAEGTGFSQPLPVGVPLYSGVQSWTINWGDSKPASTLANGVASAPHTYDDSGSYTVTVSASDGGAPRVVASWAMTVTNVAPTAALGVDSTMIRSGETVRASFTAPHDDSAVDAASLRYSFASSPDGLAATYADAGTSSYADVGFGGATGALAVYGRVFDKDGGYSDYTSQAVFVLPEQPPLAGASVFQSPTGQWPAADVGGPGQFVSLWYDLGGTAPFPAGTYALTVDWGDGTDVAGPADPADAMTDDAFHLHVYDEDGHQAVTLTLTDVLGGTTTLVVPIGAKPIVAGPVDAANPDNPRFTVAEGEENTFGFRALGAEPGEVVRWYVDWGDGTHDSFDGASGALTHAYPDGPADFTLRATAYAPDDAPLLADPVPVHVSNVAPTLTISGPSVIKAGEDYRLDLSSTDPGQDTVTGWTIDWGDGTTSTAAAGADHATHKYLSAGARVIKATATDEDGSYAVVAAADASFGTEGQVLTGLGLSAFVSQAVPMDGGRFLVAGGLEADDSVGMVVLARYLVDGTPDPSFNSGAPVVATISGFVGQRFVAVRPDGRILVAVQTSGGILLLGFLADGSADPAIGGGTGRAASTAPDGFIPRAIWTGTDGSIRVAGVCGTDVMIGAFDGNGSLNTSVEDDGWATADRSGFATQAVVFDADGNVLVGGMRWDDEAMAVSRYFANGAFDSLFGDDGTATVTFSLPSQAYQLFVEPDGRIVAAAALLGRSAALVRLRADGTLDPTFGDGGRLGLTVSSPLVGQGPDGGFVVAGAADFFDGSHHVYRVTAGGAASELPTSFMPEATALLPQADGAIVFAAGVESGFLLRRYGYVHVQSTLSFAAIPDNGNTTQVRLEYASDPAQELQLEMVGPGDLNYHVVKGFPSSYSPGTHAFSVTGLSPAGGHYAFRLRVSEGGQVRYVTAFAETTADPVSLSTPPQDLRQLSAAGNGTAPTQIGFTWDDGNAPYGFTVTVRAYVAAFPMQVYNAEPYEYTVTVLPDDFTTDHRYALSVPLPAYADQVELRVGLLDDEMNETGAVSAWAPLQLTGVAPPPATPDLSLVAALAPGGDGSVTVTLGAPSDARVYGITAGNQVVLLGEMGGGSTISIAASPALTSARQLIAIDGTRVSNLVVRPGTAVTPPAVVTNLAVTMGVSPSGQPLAHLTWDNTPDDEANFVIQRLDLSDLGSPAWVTVGTTGADQTAFDDTSADPAHVYHYRVLATNLGGNNGPSRVALAWFAPIVSAISVYPSPAVQGRPITLSATARAASDKSGSLTYRWSVKDASHNPVDLPNGGVTSEPSLTFTPSSWGEGWTVTLVVTDEYLAFATTVGPTEFDVSSATALQVVGPTFASEGQTVNFTQAGATSNIHWSVTRSGSSDVLATGSDSDFWFTPHDSGTYVITVTGDDDEGTHRNESVNLAVAHVAPTVTVSGPSVAFEGNASTFTAKVDQAAGANDVLSYQWDLLKADGATLTANVGAQSSVVVPGSLAHGSYQLRLTVTALHQGTPTQVQQTFPFVVLSDPTSPDFDWGALPLPGRMFNANLVTSSVIRQPDGKLLIAANDAMVSWGPSLIARFNADFTLDTSFGPNHTGVVTVDMNASTASELTRNERLPIGWPVPFEATWPNWSGVSEIFAMTINPVNQDIIVVGDAARGDRIHTQLSVAAFVSVPTVMADGTLLLPGMPDPNFNGGHPMVLTGHDTVSRGFSVTVLQDGSILAGGMEMTWGTSEAVDAVNDEFADLWPPLNAEEVRVSDFLLVKLTPHGQLDMSFNGSGIAAQPGLMELPSLTPFGNAHPTAMGLRDFDWNEMQGIRSLIVLDNGQIVAGGFINRNPLYVWDIYPLLGTGVEGTGFSLVRYNANGTIDADFGDDGKTFTSATVFTGAPDSSALLTAMHILPNGEILAAGTADTFVGYGSSIHSPIVLAKYDTTGHLDLSYGTGGVVTAYKLDNTTPVPIANLITAGGYIEYAPVLREIDHRFDGGWDRDGLLDVPRPIPLAFQSDGNLLASIMIGSGPGNYDTWDATWHVVRIDGDTGQLDTTFAGTGDLLVDPPFPQQGGDSWDFPIDPDTNHARPVAVLPTPEGVIGVGDLYMNDFGLDSMGVPVLFRYRSTPTAAAADLTTTATAAGAVVLTWKNSGFGQEGFEIRRAASYAGLDSSDAVIGHAGPNQTDYVDPAAASTSDAGAQPNTTYYYRVVPFFTGGTGAPADAAPVHTFPANAEHVLQETVAVPINGNEVTSNTVLQDGQTYILIASGDIHLNSGTFGGVDQGYIADAGYWFRQQLVLALTGLSANGAVATASTASAPGLSVGALVYITGADQAQYNGLVTVTSVLPSGFKYSVPAGTPPVATGLHLEARRFVRDDANAWSSATEDSKSFGDSVRNDYPTVAISGMSFNSATNTVTVTTTSAHGYAAGDVVRVWGAAQWQYNGAFTITAVTGTTFTFAALPGTPAAAAPAIGASLEAQKIDPMLAISGMAFNSVTNTVTVTTTAAHGYAVGDVVRISGAAQWQYNGAFTITAVTGTTFTFAALPGTPATATGASLQVQKINDIKVGIDINGTGPVGPNRSADWGQPDPVSHTYMYVYVGQGSPLTFRFRAPDYSAASVEPGDHPLQVQIYAVNSSAITPDASAPAVMRIISPASPTVPTAAVNGNTPIDILAAKPDGTPVPWALWLVSAAGERTLLTHSDASVGQLPDTPASVFTLNPALYPNGLYTLQLTSTLDDPESHIVDSRPITLATAVKVGNLTLPATDGSISTPVGPIAITRTYDSLRAGQPAGSIPGFGPGWTLDLLDSHLTTTARADTRDPSQKTPVLRAGDLVSITVPEDGRHVFAFNPIPISNAVNYGHSTTSVIYAVNFTAVDGSGATLTLPDDSWGWPFAIADDQGAMNGLLYHQYALAYDPVNDEYVMGGSPYPEDQSRMGNIGFNPARPAFGGQYQLTTRSGKTYSIDASTGQILATSDLSGNTIHYNVGSDGSITAVDRRPDHNTVLTIKVDTRANGEKYITSIDVPDQPSIVYRYDSNGNLTSVQNQAGDRMIYAYQDSDHPHFLTGVIDALGTTVLQAQYDSASGRLRSITNATGRTVPVSSTSFGPNEAIQTLVNAAGEITENVFNEKYGTLDRQIRWNTESSSYVVTVNDYSYVTNDLGNMSALRRSGVTLLKNIANYAGFEVAGPDAAGTRYSLHPDAGSWVKLVTFDTSEQPDDTARDQVVSVSQRISDDGTLQTTRYQDYYFSTIDSGILVPGWPSPTFPQGVMLPTAKPQIVTQEIQLPGAPFFYRGAPLHPVADNTWYGVISDHEDYTLSISGSDWLFDVRFMDSHVTYRAPLAGNPTPPIGSGKWTFDDATGPDTLAVDMALLTSNILLQSKTFTHYNERGVLDYTYAIITPDTDPYRPGNWWAQGTSYTYDYWNAGQVVRTANDTVSIHVSHPGSDTADPTPIGQIESTPISSSVTQTQNAYYTADQHHYVDDGGTVHGLYGGSYGQLRYTFDAAGQETYYAYDDAGHPILQYTYKTWSVINSAGNLVQFSGWVGTTSTYDALGRLTDVYQATYRDTAGIMDGAAHVLPTTYASAVNTWVAHGGILSSVTEQVGVAVNELVYAAPMLVQHNDYNTLGQLTRSVDPFGGQTYYTYDGLGHLIRTQNPDGTETRTAYDELGRVVWQTDRFVPASRDPSSAANAAVATKTVYNSLGQVARTERYTDVAVEIINTKSGSIAAAQSKVVGGDKVSTTEAFYDPSGRVIETVSPTGLRTGTIYYPDGRVQYTGPLLAADEATDTAPQGGRLVTVDGVTTRAFSFSDFASSSQAYYDQYDAKSGLFYDITVDANYHSTYTYKDAVGRTVKVVYHGGTSTQTLNGLGTQAVGGHAVSEQGPITGHQETSVDQYGRATDYFFDANNRLTDVWQPAVIDADPDSPTYGLDPADTDHYNVPVRPHTTYVYDTAGNETLQVTPKEQPAYQAWLEEYTTTVDRAAHPFTGGTSFTYDQYGNMVRRTLPGGEHESWTYDAFGRQLTHTDFDGNVATASYYPDDSSWAGRIHTITRVDAAGNESATQVVTYTYDAMGHRKTVDDASGLTTYSYDDFGNLAQAVTPEGTIHYVYDLATQQHVRTYTDHTDTLYAYDAQGRLADVYVLKAGGVTYGTYTGDDAITHQPTFSGTPLTTAYTYDDAGNKKSETLPNGDVTTYTYDGLNRLTDVLTQHGTTTLFSQHYILNDDGTRKSSHVEQRQPDGTTIETIDTTWTYDDLQRLTGESADSSDHDHDYARAYTYDLQSNRMSMTADGETIHYVYSDNDELVSEPDNDGWGYGYDDNGSMTSHTNPDNNITYVYDVRNKLVEIDVEGVEYATYVYDDAGNRVAETVGGVTTYYLTDDLNPSGYSQPLEARDASGNVKMTYLTGDRVYGQVTDTGTASYLLADSHGSTQALAHDAGGVDKTYRYDAYGNAIGFDPSAPTAGTVFLFGGDAIYDPASGMYLHGNGVRARMDFHFVQRDSYAGNPQDPLSLHKYLYVSADPVNMWDPSGYVGSAVDTVGSIGIGEAAEGGEGSSAFAAMNQVRSWLLPMIDNFNAMQGGFINMAMAPSGVNPVGAFMAGYIGAFTESYLKNDLKQPCWLAAGVGGAIVQAGNDVLAGHGSIMDVVEAGLVAGMMTYAIQGGCFVAGTEVLLGDGATKQAIDQIHVGQRVLTDGGVANSADGQTGSADPNATEVDPATWRELTITVGDWEIQALEPLAWISARDLAAGGSICLADLIDVAEMGAPADLYGTVDSIGDCPAIAAGPGRVVLTTVSHLSNFVYDLVMEDAQGHIQTLGVTGTHRFYDVKAGWEETQDLFVGEALRGENGDLTVVSLIREGGISRVYNMTVEGDHVYYVGDLTALVHNSCSSDARELRKALLNANEAEGKYAAHLVPSNRSGPLFDWMRNLLNTAGVGKNSAANGFFTDLANHNGTHTNAFYNEILTPLLERAEAAGGNKNAVLAALDEAKAWAQGLWG